MPVVHFHISLEGPSLGTLEATCPHCATTQPLDRRSLHANFMFFPLPRAEALVCPKCKKASRFEGKASRIFGVVFLSPFALLLAVGICTGLYFLGSMFLGEFSMAFAAIALALIGVAGYLEYLVIRGMKRLLGKSKLLPMDGLMTRL